MYFPGFVGESFMVVPGRTPQEWFQEAARCYLDKHQACAWCGWPHRVYQLVQDQQIVYYCYGCDFRAGHDKKAGEFFSFPGAPATTAKKTMLHVGI
jgi:hypothetical protein